MESDWSREIPGILKLDHHPYLKRKKHKTFETTPSVDGINPATPSFWSKPKENQKENI